MKIKETTKDFIIIICSAICMIYGLNQAKETNDVKRELKQTKEIIVKYKAKLKQCDSVYTINVKNLDSISKELYQWQDASFRARENVKQLRRFVKENM